MHALKKFTTCFISLLIFLTGSFSCSFADEISETTPEIDTTQEIIETSTDEPVQDPTDIQENPEEKELEVAPESTMMATASEGGSEEISNGISTPTAATSMFTGAASSSIPILVPPGRVGLQPNLSLTYNSYKKNSWIGMGWDLNIGAIQRSTKRGVDYTADDYQVMMGGNSELIDRSADWGNNFYGAKIEGGFTKYYYNSSTKGWEATDKSGKKYYYGTTAASRQDDPSNSNHIFKWCLDKVVDTNLNYMTISYTKDQNQIYLEQIDYTGNEGSSPLLPTNSVIFHLEDIRSDQQKKYQTGFKVITAKRLKSIEVKAAEDLVRKYELE